MLSGVSSTRADTPESGPAGSPSPSTRRRQRQAGLRGTGERLPLGCRQAGLRLPGVTRSVPLTLLCASDSGSSPTSRRQLSLRERRNGCGRRESLRTPRAGHRADRHDSRQIFIVLGQQAASRPCVSGDGKPAASNVVAALRPPPLCFGRAQRCRDIRHWRSAALSPLRPNALRSVVHKGRHP